jgi:signal transduction histidine kinase
VFRSLRSRLVLSFALIIAVTLAATGIALVALLGGYRDQLTASTLRDVAAPIYYNVTLFTPGSGGQQRLRADLAAYLNAQQRDSHVSVLLIDASGSVIPESRSDPDLTGERFPVEQPPARGPDFRQLPEQRRTTASGERIIYVTVPMPRSVRLAPAGVSEIIVAAPEATPRQVLRDIAPRLLFAGLIGLATATLAAIILWASLYRPLGRVARGIRAVANGRYGEPVPVSGPTEVRALAADVNQMAAAVQASQRALRQFLANVSHELKTPLTSIRGFAQAMNDGTLDTQEERERAARVIDAESRRVLHMVEELLDLTRIESGQQTMEMGDVGVAELFSQVADVYAMRADEAGIILTVAPPPDTMRARADFERIEQVLGNLVDNAFRHTPRGGRIDVTARTAGRACVELSVADNGSGIEESDLPHVFDRFYRSDAEVSGSGSGLGLAISREIVRAHGGEIRAARREGGGAVISLTLPAAPASIGARDGADTGGHLRVDRTPANP